GRENANYDLVQQQMKRAGSWRLGLRRSVLNQLARLGRDGRLFQASPYGDRNSPMGAVGGPVDSLMSLSSSTPMGRPGSGPGVFTDDDERIELGDLRSSGEKEAKS